MIYGFNSRLKNPLSQTQKTFIFIPQMKSSVEHLPAHKQNELKTIVEAITTEFKNVEMIILFGSYARGEQVEDTYIKDGGIYEYRSDFDLLIVLTHSGKENNAAFKHKVNQAIRNTPIETPARTIIQGVNSVNQLIDMGSPLFNDIRAQGIMLYTTGNFNLGNPRKLKPQEVLKNAEEDFAYWFTSASTFYENFEHNLTKGNQGQHYYNTAAFELHQATERLYAAILMVFTGYKAKDHDIESLGTQVNELDRRFEAVFPMNTDEESHHFYLLKAAYVDARYEKNYKITKEELHYLSARVQLLKELTEKICTERIGILQQGLRK